MKSDHVGIFMRVLLLLELSYSSERPLDMRRREVGDEKEEDDDDDDLLYGCGLFVRGDLLSFRRRVCEWNEVGRGNL